MIFLAFYSLEVSSELVSGHKRFLKTIIDQLPIIIEQYPLSDQIFLNRFLKILKLYEKADYDRKNLSEQFQDFIRWSSDHDEYLRLPFLWFTVSYFEKSDQLLNVAKFRGDDFYGYLVQPLRGYPKTAGVFQLLRERTSLKDLIWEQLQYASYKLRDPLSKKQLQILEVTYSLIRETGIFALSQNRLKKTVDNAIDFSKKRILSKNLNYLFTRIDARWYLRFFYQAFGIEQLYLQFQLSESISLTEIIDFENPSTMILSNSDVYRVRGFQNTYICIIHIPTSQVGSLQTYLEYCERQGYIILNEIVRITNSCRSSSLALYKAEYGWQEISPASWSRLVKKLSTIRPRKRRTKQSSLFYLTPLFNEFRNYRQYPNPPQVIALFCFRPLIFSYSELPLGSTNPHIPLRLKKSQLRLLKKLYSHQLIEISFNAVRLTQEFSLDTYWLKIPRIPIEQLSRLLEILPFSHLFLAETQIYIWTYLSPILARWMSQDLEWTILQVEPYHKPKKLDLNWFNSETLEWKSPDF